MSSSQSIEIKRPENLVRLKVDGQKMSVNTLMDQETARGVSLVCPFPALEVDIPVQFGDTANLNIGSIHRIGVEDDPETGFPRLRLSIRTRGTRPTVVAKTSESLLAAVKTAIDPPCEDTGELSIGASLPSQISAAKPNEKTEGSWADFIAEISSSTENKNEQRKTGPTTERRDEEYSTTSSSTASDEPQWAVGELLPPEELEFRQSTKRRFKMARHMVGAFVLGMVFASLYLFEKAGVINLDDVKNKVASILPGNRPVDSIATASTLPKMETGVMVLDRTIESVDKDLVEKAAETIQENTAIASSSTIQDSTYSTGPNPLTAGLIESSAQKNEPQANQVNSPTEKQETVAEEKDEQALSEGEINLLLPTKWPVEYATAYRVREPNGVVVDVPGGLVKKEGWMEDGKENPQVRSIKSIQRESGARFIVYVNGELPRFITTPKQNGVALRLYFADEDMSTAAVASLSK